LWVQWERSSDRGGHPRRAQQRSAEGCDFAHPRTWCNRFAHDSVSHLLHLWAADRPVRHPSQGFAFASSTSARCHDSSGAPARCSALSIAARSP
jgi:hypothetical protein